jgi:uncharacterized repeat protein (TIGR01451 family)/MYXO-CTERM domain-containing protein
LFSVARSRVALAAVCSALAMLACAAPVFAAGSANLWPNGAAGSRANTEWRTGSYGNGALTRRTLVKAYMTAGQVLLLGSSAMGQGLSDIRVYNPNLVTGSIGTETIPAVANFSCAAQRLASGIAAQGIIASRAEELLGPDTIPAGGVVGGYVPCHYAAPSAGIFRIAFIGPLGAASNVDGAVAADVALAAAGDFNATQGTSIAAWDATVRASLGSAADITGRVFTYYLALFTGGNGLPVFPSVYAVTRDAYKYKIDLRGMDPNGWLVYGNQVGFLDSDGTTPLYHDAVADATGSPGQLTGIQGGVSLARPSFPLFFEPPAAATIAALGIPAAPIAPLMSAISFGGKLGGNTSLVNQGGTFKFTTNVPGVYDIVISRDGVDFDPTNPLNRSLRGVVAGAGVHTVLWDGLDNSNTAFPVGAYQAHVSLHGGEYHFPMIDVENDTTGGPTITMQNAPGGVCPPLTGGCSGAFYDDRAYMTRNGTVVNSGNTVGTVLCGTAPPTTAASNTITGFDSSGTQRAFGAASGGNNNVPCTGNFGDAKGLDIWTYNLSNTVVAPLVIVGAAADIRVRKSVSDATPAVGTNVTFTISAKNLGPNAATGVQVRDILPPGLAFVSATPSAGTAYTAGTGVWDIGNLALNATATLRIVATVTGTTKVTNVASRLAGTPPDFDPGNNTSRASVTGSTVPGLPNTGTPPVGSWWPALLALLGVLAIVPWRRRRPRPESRSDQAGS